jgi:hypothetical protein
LDDKLIMKTEFERMWKEVVTSLEVLFRNLLGGTEENKPQDSQPSGQELNPGRSEYKQEY